MALFRKAGSLLGRTVSSSLKQDILVSSSSILQSIRCMSTSKVFVGGLSYNTDEASLKEVFDKYGEVIDAKVIFDRETGRSRGFGFVTYTSPEEASAAIQALDQQDIHGRTVKVNFANERSSGGGGFRGGNFGGGGGGFGGGYGSGGGGGYGGNYGGGGGYGGNYGGGGGYGGGAGNYGSGGYSGGGGGYGGGSNYNSGGSSFEGGAARDAYPAAGGESQSSYGGGNMSYSGDGQNLGGTGHEAGNNHSYDGGAAAGADGGAAAF